MAGEKDDARVRCRATMARAFLLAADMIVWLCALSGAGTGWR